MENIDRLELGLINAFEVGAQDGRFSQPHLTQERHESLAFFDAVDQCPQGSLMAWTQEEEFWIWSDVKRCFFQKVKIEIHGSMLPACVLPCSRCPGAQLYP